ncbi:MAG: hypothetical protein V4548_11510 [Bacteroidota bacterium]
MDSNQSKLLLLLAQLGEVNITTHTIDGNIIFITNYGENNSDKYTITQEDIDSLPDDDFLNLGST